MSHGSPRVLPSSAFWPWRVFCEPLPWPVRPALEGSKPASPTFCALLNHNNLIVVVTIHAEQHHTTTTSTTTAWLSPARGAAVDIPNTASTSPDSLVALSAPPSLPRPHWPAVFVPFPPPFTSITWVGHCSQQVKRLDYSSLQGVTIDS